MNRLSVDKVPVATAIYKGSGKKWFMQIAEQLEMETVDAETEKPLSMDALKDEILCNLKPGTVFILPEAKRLTTAIRYWLEDAIAADCVIVAFAVAVPMRDVWLDMVTIELDTPDGDNVRSAMIDEAHRLNWQIDDATIAKLLPLAGGNVSIARKVIRGHRIGITHKAKPEHKQYVVIMPILIAALFSFAVLRYIGMGTGNQSMKIFGGVALVAAMALKQLGQVKGSTRGYGQ
jgi:hypothetical protein